MFLFEVYCHDFGEHFFEVGVIMGNLASQELVISDSEAEPVRGVSVSLPQNDFWGQVLRSPAERKGLFFPVGIDAAESKVSQSHVALFIHENVVGLQVPEDDVVAVEVLERQANRSHVKLGFFL